MLLHRAPADGGDQIVVQFEPRQTLQNCETCRATLLDALDHAAAIRLDAGDVIELDLTFLQTLTALRRTAQRQGMQLSWQPRPAPAVADLAERLGFAAVATDDGAFWRECPR
jgi:anti-anti-sigma regulatory factor